MISKLIGFAKEIIVLSDSIIENNSSPNTKVAEIIKREFEKQYESLRNQGKVIVLNQERDLWAWRTIIDSAHFDYDKILIEKVFEFVKLIKKLPKQNLTILY
ncbi:MAG: hypothetical protein K2M95_05565 [Clostridiales bacterium]|nr:hypothetical protein [Clostridiales bacterium]